MRLRNVVLVVIALVAAVAIGVFVRTHVGSSPAAPGSARVDQPEKPLNAPVAAEPEEHLARPRSRTASMPSVPASTPGLQNALKPLLNRGTKMDKAADGFESGVQFAAVAHAAKNTAVPFVVLKHRVLNERKSLAAAIHESKPELNAKREATRAWDEARQELSEL